MKRVENLLWRGLLLSFFLLLPSLAQAWNAAGHRVIAALAWKEMRPDVRKKASELLKRHPDYPRWKKRQREADVQYGVFLEAAVWADDIRRDPRFHDANEPPTPRLPGFPDMLRHSDWHFRNESGAKKRGEIDIRIPQLARDLGQTRKAVYALPWFLHLVGDMHQPLHVGGRGDGGGNGFEVENPTNPKRPFLSLHAYWDGLPGPSGLRGKALARELASLGKRPAPVEGNVALWRAESAALIDTVVYPAHRGKPGKSGRPPRVRLTPAFHERAREVARTRIFEAGIRLGHQLNRLLR
ncbi:MAG: S1/P1 nuclease [Zoogloeaceae bacterium]|nr:S1/P1 nuclease [Zoogloeaceae bacterium]